MAVTGSHWALVGSRTRSTYVRVSCLPRRTRRPGTYGVSSYVQVRTEVGKRARARAPGVRNARRRRRRRRRKMIDVGIKSSAPTRTWPMRTNVYPSANNIACEWRINLPGVRIGPTTAGLYADPVEIRECRFRVIVSLQNIPTWYFYSWRREREGRISTNALRSARWSWNCTFGGARKTANPPIDKYLLKNLWKKLQKILLDYYLIILRLKSR